MQPVKTPSESHIQKKVIEHARSIGWLCYKFSSDSNRGVPDFILMSLGVVFFIEFKAPGKKPRKNQLSQMRKIQSQEIPCFVIDNVEDGIDLINDFDDHGRAGHDSMLLSVEAYNAE